MVDIRPNQLPDAILPLRETDELVVDQGTDGVRKAPPIEAVNSVAPVATQADAVAGTNNVKRMTALRTKQSIASEVGVTLASNSQGEKADSAVQSVNGKSGNSVTLVKGDIGLGNVDNTSDADKPVSTATQDALDAKANSSVIISAGTGLTGGGNLTANRTVSLNAASIVSLAKADSSVQTVNGVSPTAGNVTVSAEEKRLQDTRTAAIAESFGSNVQFVETAGYSSVGDGGGALYKRVASEPPHEGKFQSEDGAWWELADGEVIARSFGISTAPDDNTLALQRAIDYSNSKEDGPLYLPSGAFIVGDLDLKGVSLIGTGQTRFISKTGADRILSDSTTEAINIRGITLDGDNKPGGAFQFLQNNGIILEDVNLCNFIDRAALLERETQNIQVRGGRIYSNTAADIYVVKGRNNSFIGLSFSDCTQHVIRFGRFSNDPDLPSGINSLVSGCTFYNIQNDPVLFEIDSRYGAVLGNQYFNCRRIVKCEGVNEGGVDAVSRIVVADNVFSSQTGVDGEAIRGLGVRGMIVKGNSITGSYQGISVGEDSIVEGNIVDTTTSMGIVADGTRASISGNTLRSIGGTAIRCTLSRCVVSGNRINGTDVGIRLDGSDCIVTGNHVAVSGIGVHIVSTANYCTVSGNNLRETSGTKISNAGSNNTVTPNIV